MGNDKTEIMNEVIELLFQRCEQDELEKICEKLEKIYLIEGKINREYRHEYSAISGKIEELNERYDAERNPYDMQTLATNINILYEFVADNNKQYRKMVFKLRDHICLEIARISYADKIYAKIMNTKSELREEIQKSREDLNDIDSKINKAQDMLDKLDEKSVQIEELTNSLIPGMEKVGEQLPIFQDKLENVETELKQKEEKINSFQKEYISILGIFASIVLTFNAGIAFSSSVLENINNSSVYRVVLVTLIIGIVLANVLFALFHYIDKLVFKEPRLKVLNRVNVILLTLVVLTVAAWSWGIVERRNDRINNPVKIENINTEETMETQIIDEAATTTK